MGAARGEGDVLDDAQAARALHGVDEQALVLRQEDGPSLARQQPRDLGEDRGVERLVARVRADALPEREIRDDSIRDTVRHRNRPRVAAPDHPVHADPTQVLGRRGGPPRVVVPAEDPAERAAPDGRQERSRATEGIENRRLVLDLRQPGHDRGDHGVRRRGRAEQLAETARPVQSADLGAPAAHIPNRELLSRPRVRGSVVRFDVDVPRARIVVPAGRRQRVTQLPPRVTDRADPKPNGRRQTREHTVVDGGDERGHGPVEIARQGHRGALEIRHPREDGQRSIEFDGETVAASPQYRHPVQVAQFFGEVVDGARHR